MEINEEYYHALGILSEECAEIIQIISKIQRFGIDSYHPETLENNADSLNMEYNDLLGSIKVLHCINPDASKIIFNKNEKSIKRKETKIMNMMDVSKKLGRL